MKKSHKKTPRCGVAVFGFPSRGSSDVRACGRGDSELQVSKQGHNRVFRPRDQRICEESQKMAVNFLYNFKRSESNVPNDGFREEGDTKVVGGGPLKDSGMVPLVHTTTTVPIFVHVT